MAREPVYERDYEVLSKWCVYGEVGEIVSLTMTENQELSLLESGAVKRAEPRLKHELKGEPGPEKVQFNRPGAVVNKEGKRHG
jgi:hypothetical protein